MALSAGLGSILTPNVWAIVGINQYLSFQDMLYKSERDMRYTVVRCERVGNCTNATRCRFTHRPLDSSLYLTIFNFQFYRNLKFSEEFTVTLSLFPMFFTNVVGASVFCTDHYMSEIGPFFFRLSKSWHGLSWISLSCFPSVWRHFLRSPGLPGTTQKTQVELTGCLLSQAPRFSSV